MLKTILSTPSNYEKLVEIFIMSGEPNDYDSKKRCITLYNMPNTPETIKRIRLNIELITKEYKLTVVEEKEEFSNFIIEVLT